MGVMPMPASASSSVRDSVRGTLRGRIITERTDHTRILTVTELPPTRRPDPRNISSRALRARRRRRHGITAPIPKDTTLTYNNAAPVGSTYHRRRPACNEDDHETTIEIICRRRHHLYCGLRD